MLYVFCLYSDETLLSGLKYNLQLKGQNYTLIPMKHEKEMTLTSAYNKMAKSIPGPQKFEEIYCFIHQDARLLFSWDDTIHKFMEYSHNPGVVGFVGTDKITARGRWWLSGRRCGKLLQGPFKSSVDENLCFEKLRQRLPGVHVMYEPVDAMDGYCLFINRRTFHDVGGFDERFKWHLYDTDLCLSCLKKGYTNYVIGEKSQHFSPGDFTVNWEPIEAVFREKWLHWLKENGR